jgi:hypothetical protein
MARPLSMTPRAVKARESIVRARLEGRCMDCSIETTFTLNKADEYYMVNNALWMQANPQCEGTLCIGCLESRIGRLLTWADFTDCPLNKNPRGSSKRLRNRLGI